MVVVGIVFYLAPIGVLVVKGRKHTTFGAKKRLFVVTIAPLQSGRTIFPVNSAKVRCKTASAGSPLPISVCKRAVKAPSGDEGVIDQRLCPSSRSESATWSSNRGPEPPFLRIGAVSCRRKPSFYPQNPGHLSLPGKRAPDSNEAVIPYSG